MLIIIDNKISQSAKDKLSTYSDLLELKTEGITYPAISGHPDIFFCQAPGHLIVAPNLPEKYFELLKLNGVDFILGEMPVGPEYPASSRYNAVATDKLLIHNFRQTDFMITRTLDELHPVHVDQGYCRCNLLPLKDGHFITSDEGIFKVLMRCHLPSDFGMRCHLNVLFVSPSGIKLEGFPHGFFGGCCGVMEDRVFINGSLEHYPEGEKVRKFLTDLEYKIIELSDGPLVDVGSILHST
jgi:hypothetical protein